MTQPKPCPNCNSTTHVHPYGKDKFTCKQCRRYWRTNTKQKRASPTMTLQERFLLHTFVTDGCWIWTGTRSGPGSPWQQYGDLSINGRMRKAHRVAYELYVGPIPPGLYILHTCDNPPCVNPTHLFTGTQKDNLRDCVQKGRHSSAQQKQRRGHIHAS